MSNTCVSAPERHMGKDEKALTITVIIPTKNRAGDLHRTIDSLIAQTHRPDELIVVDQSFVPSLDPASVPLPVTYIYDPHISGLTEARNVAMNRATGDIWLFLDDDVILEPEYVAEVMLAYSPEVAGVSGIITNYKRPGLSRRLFEAVFVRGPFHDDRQPVYWRADVLRQYGPRPVKQLGGGLMSFRAALIRDLRFDTNLTGGCLAEDIDFCARLPQRAVLLIVPKARLSHERSSVGRATAHWLDAHAQSSTYMHLRNWHRGLRDDLWFAWLQVGYTVMAAVGSLKRGSLEPFRAWRQGRARGSALGAPSAKSSSHVLAKEAPA